MKGNSHGELYRVSFDNHVSIEENIQKIQELVENFPNNLVTFTTLTQKLLGNESQIIIGHNGVGNTDEKGVIQNYVSKRLDPKNPIGKSERIFDNRLNANYSPQIYTFLSLFTEHHTEMEIWAKHASKSSNEYYLFIHRIPLTPKELETFKNNATEVKAEFPSIYRLHSVKDKNSDRYLPGQNCNTALCDAVLGPNYSKEHKRIQEMCTQGAVFKVMSQHLAEYADDYTDIARELGLTEGVEEPEIEEEMFFNLFTC